MGSEIGKEGAGKNSGRRSEGKEGTVNKERSGYLRNEHLLLFPF